MKLSIVATMYRSAPFLHNFCARASTAARQVAGEDYEIVLVNDGSPDGSLEVALRLREQNKCIVIVDLSRNFGHHKAMMTGLSHARGSLVFLIDCDLEESPEWLVDFLCQMQADGCDVVYGVQETRKGGFFERMSGQAFYRLFNALTKLDISENMLVVRLMTRRYVHALLEHREREVFLAALWHITGFDQRARYVKKLSRHNSTYTLGNKVAMLVTAITSFSDKPLVYIFYTGMLIFCIAVTFAAWLIIQWMFFARALTGWPSIMASIWLLGGLNISFIGMIGIYLAKVFSETKHRPYTIVRQIFGRDKHE